LNQPPHACKSPYRTSAFGGRTEHESANPIVYLQRSCKVRFLFFRFIDLSLAYRLAKGSSDFPGGGPDASVVTRL
jgi:hypothetical protein